jgi:Subtilase family
LKYRRTRILATLTAAAAALTFGQTLPAIAAANTSSPAPAGSPAPLSTAQAHSLSQHVDTPVIVLMRHQPAANRDNTTSGHAATKQRDKDIADTQAPLVSELGTVHAKHVRRYSLVNAVSATVSKGEEDRLKADPNVAEVVPDTQIKLGQPAMPGAPAAGGTAAQAPADATSSGSQVCPAPGKTMLEPEALDATHTDSDDAGAKTAHGLGVTGKGVKIGFLADGLDINNPDFIRPDGSHVFAGYKDFSGDGTAAPTSGDEAFLDASAIAAQGNKVYDISHFGAHPLPTACDIRILGMAPGASLYGYKVIADSGFASASSIVEAVQYAVETDHVDVLNESLGSNPAPDSGTQDAFQLADSAAKAAGVTVTVSSGDAGTNGTQGSPATDPSVISVGASTTFRWLAQTDYGAYQQFATNGWLNDNVSSLSSSGVDTHGRTIDLLAPGDSSFALCTPDAALYTGCVDFNNKPSDVERSGGTSESSPMVAGGAALVIQAYRQTHHGASPTPSLVKQILTSTATDLTEPSDEQGTGLLDTYKAVQAAQSVGNPAHATGSTLLVDKDQLDAAGKPGSTQRFDMTVTNTGAKKQTVALSGRGFGPARTVRTNSVTLSDTGKHFADWSGVQNNYQSFTFSVPKGQQRLSASIAYSADSTASLNARVRLILIDPHGRFAAHSLPQGIGNFGNVDVRLPVAGTWTAAIYSPTTANSGYTGKVLFTAATQQTVATGSVGPRTLTLAPGQSRQVSVTAKAPTAPGDTSDAVVLDAGAGGTTSVPIVLRSLVDPAAGGAFHGTLTGGNGRQAAPGQSSSYQFDVPAGQRDVAASVDLTNDPADSVEALLVDPQGNAQAFGTNELTSAFDPATHTGTSTQVTQTDLYARAPMPGRWTLVINFEQPTVGDEISQPFTGRVRFDTVDVRAKGLPDGVGAVLPAGRAVTVPVTVHNTGTAPEDFFVDPRLNTTSQVPLAAVEPTDVTVPLSLLGSLPTWLVPSETTGLTVTAQATGPVSFDFEPSLGDPDLLAQHSGDSATGVVNGNPLQAGTWLAVPAAVGPFAANSPKPESVTMKATATTKAFDPSVTSAAGDLWQSSTALAGSLKLVTVQPGASATIPVTITPSGKRGTVVSGTLYVDQLVGTSSVGEDEPTANEMTGIPYRYIVG